MAETLTMESNVETTSIDNLSEEENKLLLVSLDYIINHRIKIKNRYGFGNYLKEDGNIYFLDNDRLVA